MTYDDFRRIPGIGPVVERYLRDAGVHTYAQLAALTPEEIAGLVGDLPLLSVERIASHDWPGQARALAAAARARSEPLDGAPWQPHRYTTFTVDLLLDDRGRVLRTHVAHVQGGAEESWPAWEAERLIRFFAAHISGESSDPAVQPPIHEFEQINSSADPGDLADTSATHAAPPPLHSPGAVPAPPQRADPLLEIGDIIVYEIAPASQGGERRQRLRAELDFRLRGAPASQVAMAAEPYTVQLLAQDLAAGRAAVLAASHGRLLAGQLDYTAVLEFPLPDDGRYQLIGVVLLPDLAAVASALGPVLKVVP